MKHIFLSASIPKKDRNPAFYETADVFAIRDSVRALATLLNPDFHLVWGGHPSITPLIRSVLQASGGSLNERVTLYQSMHFFETFPSDNREFEQVEYTPAAKDLNESLLVMRKAMLSDRSFVAGVFIGGMEGILLEYNLFKEYNPEAIILPIGSTGGAALQLCSQIDIEEKERLKTDYAYLSLFRDLLVNRIMR